MAGGVFHVEFGINETTLTRALESDSYPTAERLIRENVNPSYLDEGTLYICLTFGFISAYQQIQQFFFYILYIATILNMGVGGGGRMHCIF
jgi:hypothetical protein